MASNADTLKAAFQAFADDDLDKVMEAWHDDIRWEGTNDDRLPVGGRHEGKEDVMNSLKEIAQHWSSYAAVPDEFVEDGDTVVVLGHVDATAKETERTVSYPFVHVWRFEDGKAKEVLALSDTYEVAKALGFDEGGSGGEAEKDEKDDKDEKDEKDPKGKKDEDSGEDDESGEDDDS